MEEYNQELPTTQANLMNSSLPSLSDTDNDYQHPNELIISQDGNEIERIQLDNNIEDIFINKKMELEL